MLPQDLVTWLRVRTFSKAQLARRLGINWRTVHRWCTGESPLPDDLLARLDALGVPPRPRRQGVVMRVWVPEKARYLRRKVYDTR